jgi:hypothetical protein
MKIGIWWELPPGARWSNEGVTRVIGFLVGGAAARRTYAFHLVVRPGLGEEVREDLRQLAAEEFVDWQVHEPTSSEESHYLGEAVKIAESGQRFENVALALFANERVPVDGWIVPFPHFESAVYLERSKAVLVPDALPYDFPLGWIEDWQAAGAWPQWRQRATKMCAEADAVINFSEHVARRHAGPLLSVPRDKIHVVPLAPPDLLTELPFVRSRKRSRSSREQAAAILREHVAERGIDYLRNFPFEECEFIVDATHDRPTKNLGFTADAVERIVRRDRRPMKLFLTAQLNFGAHWTRLPTIIERQQFHRDFVSMHNLPREVHAALFHAAAVTVHSSFYEGIIGCLPFYESVSVGTPCLFARGPHTSELLESEPDLAPFTFDPYDADGLRRLILRTIDAREGVLEVQAQVYARHRRRTRYHTADGYVEAALAGRKSWAA